MLKLLECRLDKREVSSLDLFDTILGKTITARIVTVKFCFGNNITYLGFREEYFDEVYSDHKFKVKCLEEWKKHLPSFFNCLLPLHHIMSFELFCRHKL